MDDRDSEQQPKLNWEIGRSILTGKIGEGHLYYEQFETVKACCEEAARMLTGSDDRDAGRRDDSLKDVDTRDRNTVIGVVGERGSGKTSFLYSLKKSLDKEYCVLDVVDPSDFDSGMSVLELFLAQMFNEYKRLYPKYEERHGELFALPIHSNFKDLAKTLSALRTDGSVYSCENPSIEVLANMADRMAVRENIRDLCKNFLHLVNGLGEGDKKPCIVLLVDDVDLAENEHVYRMLDDVRKFLSGNIIVVLSYRESQLLDSVVDRKIKENERLIGKEVISLEEVRKQASRLVSKLLPANRVVRLYDQGDLLGKPVTEVLRALGSEEALKEELVDRYKGVARFGRKASAGDGDVSKVTVEDWINDVVYANTLIKMDPVFGLEKSAYAYPESLRDLIGFAEMVELKMEVPPVSENAKPKDSNYYRIYRNNLQHYRTHLLSRLPGTIGNGYADLIMQWAVAPVDVKNRYAYKIAYGLSLACGAEYAGNGLLAIDLMLAENVTVGDVSDVLGHLSRLRADEPQIVHFCYVLKVLYSIDLLGSLLTALLETMEERLGSAKYEQAINDYLTLVNACVIPPEISSEGPISEFYYPSYEELVQSKEALNAKGCEHLSYSWYEGLLKSFACTSVSLSSQALEYSRPYRGSGAKRAGFGNTSNRPLFYFEENNALFERNLEAEEDEGALSPGEHYWISPFNLLAKRQYVVRCLQDIKQGKSVYVFYSLFDIDVFRRMSFNLKVKKRKAMGMYLSRLNTAIYYAYCHLTGVENPRKSMSLNDRMDVTEKHEIALYEDLCAIFVNDDEYRLFDSSSLADSLTLYKADKAFESSAIIEEEVKKRKYGLEGLIEDGGKSSIRPFVENLITKLKDVALADELHTLQKMLSHLDRSSTQVTIAERRDLKELYKNYPDEFFAAYQE